MHTSPERPKKIRKRMKKKKLGKSELYLTSFNVEGLKNNNLYALEVIKKSDIVFLQEHWMYTYQIPELPGMIDDHMSEAICTDHFDRAPATHVPRGYGGVAITWKPEIHPYIRNGIKIENTRIITKKVCYRDMQINLVNVYLPSVNSSDRANGTNEYLDTLEILRQKVPTENGNTPLVLMGDFNIDPFKEENRNDIRYTTLMDMTEELNLHLISDEKLITCIGHGHRFESHLDLIFVSECLRAVASAELTEKVPWNTSVHTPIHCKINLETPLEIKPHTQKVISYAVNRKTIDQVVFNEQLEKYLEFPYLHPTVVTQYLTSAIKAAEIQAGKLTKRIHGGIRKKKVVDMNIISAAKKSRHVDYKWKLAGKPEKDHPLSIERRKSSKAVRSAHRKSTSRIKEAEYKKLMECTDPKSFSCLIKAKTAPRYGNTQSIRDKDGDVQCVPQEGADAWADYFGDLCRPSEYEEWDPKYLEFVKARVKTIRNHTASISAPKGIISEMDIINAIKKLKAGKAADIHGVSPDHIIMCAQTIAPILASTFEFLINTKFSTDMRKEKKVPVPKTKSVELDMDLYRGITIPPIFEKLLEIIILDKIGILDQNKLQFGFTKGLSPQMATLCLTELVSTSKGKCLVISTIDASKAFDLVDRDILLWELYKKGIPDYLWKVIDDIYSDNYCRIMWQGSLSKEVPVTLGTGQGKTIAAQMYKTYIDPTLESLESSGYGARIGITSVVAPSCADDIVLAATSIPRMQGLYCILDQNTRRNRSKLNYNKCDILTNMKKLNDLQFPLYIGDNEIPYSEKVKHLGLKRTAKSPSADIQAKIAQARGAGYALIPAGIHGENGVTPHTSVRTLRMNVVSILLYGLDAIIMTQKERDDVCVFFNTLVRSVLGLRKSVASSALFLLSGLYPIECELHCRIIGLYGAICRQDSHHPLKVIAQRQLANPECGWFDYLITIASKYNIRAQILNQLYSPDKPEKWKRFIKLHIKSWWNEHLFEDARDRSTLQLLDLSLIHAGETHFMYPRTGSSQLRTAIAFRTKMLTGTYTLQSNTAKFNKYKVDPTCLLCKKDPETTTHFLLECHQLEKIRNPLLSEINHHLSEIGLSLPSENPIKCLLNMGPSKKLQLGKKVRVKLSALSNKVSLLCLKLHNERHQMLAELNSKKTKDKSSTKSKKVQNDAM